MARFKPGDATAIVVGPRAAFVRSPASSRLCTALQECFAADAPWEALLEAVGRLGFSDLPAFAIAVRVADSVHLLQRGAVEVRVTHDSGHVTPLPAPRASTWREEIFEGVERVEVGDGDVDAYWFDQGVVPASSLDVSFSEMPAASAAASEQTSSTAAPPLAASSTASNVVVAVEPTSEAAKPDEPGPMSAPASTMGGPSLGTEPVEPAADEEPFASESASGDLSADLELAEPDADHSADGALGAAAMPVAGGSLASPPPPASTEDERPEHTLIYAETSKSPAEPALDESASLAAAAPSATEVSALDDLDFDLVNLVDHTVYRDVESAAMRLGDEQSIRVGGAKADAASPASSAGPDDPDHDGHTVLRRPGAGAARPATPSAGAISGPSVQAVRCPSGHLNPVGSTQCRHCGTQVSDAVATAVARPRLGVLRFSNGVEHPVDGPLVIGRQPADAIVDGEPATPLRIDHSELSRTHATVHVTDWYVHVSDNGSTNGTKVVVPGQPGEACRPPHRILITPGTVVDLGGVVTFRFDVE